jgi:predicted metal-dependent phosphoesterase TrpH
VVVPPGHCDSTSAIPWEIESFSHRGIRQYYARVRTSIIHPFEVQTADREICARIGEAERRGDFAELALLTQQKLELDRALRQLHNQDPPER